MDLKLWSTPNSKRYLSFFDHDELPPCAVFLEFITGMINVDMNNYSKERWSQFVEMMDVIHEVGILHGDPYPRNAMIVPGNPERLLWIDFDRAIICQDARWLRRQRKELTEDLERITLFGDFLVRLLFLLFLSTIFCPLLSPSCLNTLARDHGMRGKIDANS